MILKNLLPFDPRQVDVIFAVLKNSCVQLGRMAGVDVINEEIGRNRFQA